MLSMIVGILAVRLLKDTKLYQYINDNTISTDPKFYSFLGTSIIKRLIMNTSLNNFNKEIIVKSPNLDLQELNNLKLKMTNAEVGHIVAFIFLMATTIVLVLLDQDIAVLIILNILNIIFNLYPILIQQQNKLRIDRILKSTTQL